jgi:triacylglycerol lipase
MAIPTPIPVFSHFSDDAAVNQARDALAWYAQFAMYAEDLYVHDSSDPRGDIRFSPDWGFVDWLRTTVAADVVGDIEHWLLGLNDTTYFGAIFRHQQEPDQYLITIRGTESGPEWAQNVVATPDVLHGMTLALTSQLIKKGGNAKAHPDGGFVPAGFYGIYEAMTLGAAATISPPAAATGITQKIGSLQATNRRTVGDASVTVVGHSLGAAVATYLSYDLAKNSGFAQVNAYLLATPHPGDKIYAGHFTDTGVNCVSIAYERDLVPAVPPPPLYVPLAETVTIRASGSPIAQNEILANATIGDSIGGNHHAVCYAAMLSSTVTKNIACYALDKACVSCIQSPSAQPQLLQGSNFPANPWQ